MDYSFEIKKYKSGKELPIMRFESGSELLTEFLFVNCTSVSMGNSILEELEGLMTDNIEKINASFNGFNLEADKYQAILTNEMDAKLLLDTKDLIQVTKKYIIEVLKYKRSNLEGTYE